MIWQTKPDKNALKGSKSSGDELIDSNRLGTCYYPLDLLMIVWSAFEELLLPALLHGIFLEDQVLISSGKIIWVVSNNLCLGLFLQTDIQYDLQNQHNLEMKY
jgi:hypothetical protein